MAKYLIIKYYKGSKLNIFREYDDEEKANETCAYMNNAAKKFSNAIKFKVIEKNE